MKGLYRALQIIFVIMVTWIVIDNQRVVLTHYQIQNEKVKSVFKIIQLSDVHNAQYESHILEAIQKEEPDIVVITGDLIDENTPDLNQVKTLFDEIIKSTPIYYVSGNHDVNTHLYQDLVQYLETIGDQVLINKSVEINDFLVISGLGDPVHSFKTEELALDLEKFNLVLSHRPELFNRYVKEQYDLVLSGHAHGGQFQIPFVGGLIAPNQGLLPQYTSGLHASETTTMIVNRGLGDSAFPVRIFNPSEIVVIELNPMTP